MHGSWQRILTKRGPLEKGMGLKIAEKEEKLKAKGKSKDIPI